MWKLKYFFSLFFGFNAKMNGKRNRLIKSFRGKLGIETEVSK